MNPWAQSVLNSFQWGGAPQAPAAQKDDEDEEDEDAPRQRQPKAQAPHAPAFHAPAPQPNMFQEHAAMQGNMYEATNSAWAHELDNRRRQSEDERDRQHELQLASMRQAQPEPQPMPHYAAQPHARANLLAGLAGFGGHTVHSDGQGNVTTYSPFARSLLG